MDDQNARAFAGNRIVINMESFERDTALFVGDGFFNQSGRGRATEQEGKEKFHRDQSSRKRGVVNRPGVTKINSGGFPAQSP